MKRIVKYDATVAGFNIVLPAADLIGSGYFSAGDRRLVEPLLRRDHAVGSASCFCIRLVRCGCKLALHSRNILSG